jgi:hypothetical protein
MLTFIIVLLVIYAIGSRLPEVNKPKKPGILRKTAVIGLSAITGYYLGKSIR